MCECMHRLKMNPRSPQSLSALSSSTISTKSAAAPEDHQVSLSRWLTCPKDQTVSLSPVLESQVYAVGQ